MSEDKQVDRFPLTDVVEKLRSDLSKAVENAQDEDLQFKVKEIELELQAVVEENHKAEGGFNFSVLKFGGGHGSKSADTQKIKLVLQPIRKENIEEGDSSIFMSSEDD